MIGYSGIGDEAGPALDTQIAALHRLGWNAIELRTVGGVHLADLSDRQFASLATRVADAGLDVVCVDSRVGGWARSISGPFQTDLDEFDVLAERCAVLDTQYLRIMSYPNAGLTDTLWRSRVIDRLRMLADRAERAGLVLLHENCVGWAATSASHMVEMLAEVDSPALRLLFDVGNGVAYQYQAADVLAQVVEYVVHVHVKDAIATGTGTSYTLPGQGQAQVATCLRMLLTGGYTGYLSIEPHLAFRPHEGFVADDGGDAFVAFGFALRDLVDQLLMSPR